MNEAADPGSLPESDPVLESAGARLRADVSPIPPASVEARALRRRTRRLGATAVASLAVSGLLAGALVVQTRSADDPSPGPDDRRSSSVAADSETKALLASLDPAPVDPTEVQLVSSVSTFPDCDALIADLRRVGAEHVGSRGFGASESFWPTGRLMSGFTPAEQGLLAGDRAAAPAASSVGAGGGGDTLGTNVQVSGVDELDHVKAVDDLIYDLDGRGNLRITDAGSLATVSTLDVTPGSDDTDRQVHVSHLLVDEHRVVVFGSELEISDPVAGDPSATRATTAYLTVTFVDATDPAAPSVTDRVRVEGSLVSARLVEGEVRLVTTSQMADLGFLMPTTPSSVAKALEENRLTVATSTTSDWIPDWQRDGESPEPLVPCERVHVPDTFSGVSMTSMVAFPVATGRFEPAGTSILAPGATLYAGLDRVAISSEVWVDPVDRELLTFDDWQTAVHELRFTEGAAPSYEGSGLVDGSTVGQFAYGEIGDSLAVVTTEGTPWAQDPSVAVDLTILTPDGDGGLAATAQVEDLADGQGAVSAVRYVEDRVLVSTGIFGRTVHVLDVADPARPRRAGSVAIPGDVGYFHPLPDGQALVVGSRHDEVGSGNNRTHRPWVQVHLLDVQDADSPQVRAKWERPWSTDAVAQDHHTFTYWPSRQLAMWGVQDADSTGGRQPGPHHAIVLSTDGGVTEVATPAASKPPEAPAPCPSVEVTNPEVRRVIGPGGVVLRCDDASMTLVDWARYVCSLVDDPLVARFVPEDQRGAAFFHCSPAPHPTVARVLVVDGKPILLTDQTLEALDPITFQATEVVYHPTTAAFALYGF